MRGHQLPFVILFIGVLNMALPDIAWGTPVQVFHGVFLDNVVLVLYLLLVATIGRYGSLFRNRDALRFATLVALLASVGIVSAGVNGYTLNDVGEALRLFLFSAFVMVAVHWSRTFGPAFVLRSYLAGVAAGGVINIYLSVTQPELLIGILPVLRSQNGAGGALGIAISLSAWLMLIRRTRSDMTVAIASALIGTVAAAMSFSKTSMTIAACGLIAWFCILIRAMAARRGRLLGAVGLVGLIAVGTYAWRVAESSTIAGAVVRSVRTKFTNLDLRDKYSVGARYMYLWGVAEIVAKHPVAGVSYSGFYDAITTTSTYQTGEMADEDPEAGQRGQPNPHNSFLYYAAANGVLGLLIVCLLFLLFLGHLWQGVQESGVVGIIVWGCIAMAYVIYGATLPTLFDTPVLFVPAAVTIALVNRGRLRQGLDDSGPSFEPRVSIATIPT